MDKDQEHGAVAPAALVDSGEIKLTFTNFSSYTFYRDVWGANQQAVLGNLKKSPGNTLEKHGGMQVLDLGQTAFAWFADGAIDVWMTWYCEELRLRLGAKISAPMQVIGIGPRPYWRASWDNLINQEPDWKSPGDPSTQFTFGDRASWKVKVKGKPESWHTALDLVIEITDAE
ncbi:hypothetical protein [Cupriavidus pauculus]|uniref:Uncharacterized protein n=1 Tax=Cupriavidus pauculus TaxID=82633 RepID=A0A2N5C3N3_9BURK|nr:hypothetical protein [Cupriavidus pauculus]PLP96824.1 hypothetical protein CYJ10_29980 [Cupriavidus pauculus]